VLVCPDDPSTSRLRLTRASDLATGRVPPRDVDHVAVWTKVLPDVTFGS
jgi:hypothetical protein